jgi:hypothetical protein
MRLRSALPTIANIFSLFIISIALLASPLVSCRAAIIGRPGLADGPCRRRRRSNRTSAAAMR